MTPALSAETRKQIDALAAQYPSRLAAMLPALHLVMDEKGYVSPESASEVAEVLGVPPTRVHEAVTFYTMFYDRPVGRNVVKICRNLACQLRGADRLIQKAQDELRIGLGETTPDGRITLETEECLASCGTAPMLWCRSRSGEGAANERIVENLDEQKLVGLLQELR